MTVDRHTFALGMGRLSGCFGRTLDAEISRAYFTALSPRLTSDQFTAAVERTIAEDTYWPAPAVLLAKAGVTVTDRAEAAFDQVRRLCHAYPFQPGIGGGVPFAVYERECDAPTKAAIAKVGGLARFADISTEQWPKFVRRFEQAYTDAVNAPPMLPRVAPVPEITAGFPSFAAIERVAAEGSDV
jgi:hypothetical protein